MRSRLLSSLVVLLMLASPSLAAACEIVCATSENAPAPQHHACHDDAAQPSTDGPAVTPGGHACGHGGALPELSRALDVVAIPAQYPAAALVHRPDRLTSQPASRFASPPEPRSLHRPLRI